MLIIKKKKNENKNTIEIPNKVLIVCSSFTRHFIYNSSITVPVTVGQSYPPTISAERRRHREVNRENRRLRDDNTPESDVEDYYSPRTTTGFPGSRKSGPFQ
ncbi:uncharacterized protein LOC117321341 [Pecten maximus]|uniref:uncharacterized protein LOC117321341 n=1 Tax=Pecten maximus TaxID=6579 RepID=UPI001458E105|nr:uncharacterized protein LOC117321341 [Pecten maximus]